MHHHNPYSGSKPEHTRNEDDCLSMQDSMLSPSSDFTACVLFAGPPISRIRLNERRNMQELLPAPSLLRTNVVGIIATGPLDDPDCGFVVAANTERIRYANPANHAHLNTRWFLKMSIHYLDPLERATENATQRAGEGASNPSARPLRIQAFVPSRWRVDP